MITVLCRAKATHVWWSLYCFLSLVDRSVLGVQAEEPDDDVLFMTTTTWANSANLNVENFGIVTTASGECLRSSFFSRHLKLSHQKRDNELDSCLRNFTRQKFLCSALKERVWHLCGLLSSSSRLSLILLGKKAINFPAKLFAQTTEKVPKWDGKRKREREALPSSSPPHFSHDTFRQFVPWACGPTTYRVTRTNWHWLQWYFFFQLIHNG